MSCFYCKGNMVKGKTIYSVQYGDNVIVIKNVPCDECERCGEVEFTDEVMKRLEEMTAEVKKMMQEVAVMDYSKAA